MLENYGIIEPRAAQICAFPTTSTGARQFEGMRADCCEFRIIRSRSNGFCGRSRAILSTSAVALQPVNGARVTVQHVR
jgi:hypothetical protein